MKSMCRLLCAEIFAFSFKFNMVAVIECDPGCEPWSPAPARVWAAGIPPSMGIKALFAEADRVSLSSVSFRHSETPSSLLFRYFLIILAFFSSFLTTWTYRFRCGDPATFLSDEQSFYEMILFVDILKA